MGTKQLGQHALISTPEQNGKTPFFWNWFVAAILSSQAVMVVLWHFGIITIVIPSSYGATYSVTNRLPAYHPCRPPLPPQFRWDSPHPGHRALQYATQRLDTFLSHRTSKSDIDSLVLAVVTPKGAIFQKGYGTKRANETHLQHAGHGGVDENTLYRIGSISKVFAAMQTILLHKRGVLHW